jgi:hypothetical protein
MGRAPKGARSNRRPPRTLISRAQTSEFQKRVEMPRCSEINSARLWTGFARVRQMSAAHAAVISAIRSLAATCDHFDCANSRGVASVAAYSAPDVRPQSISCHSRRGNRRGHCHCEYGVAFGQHRFPAGPNSVCHLNRHSLGLQNRHSRARLVVAISSPRSSAFIVKLCGPAAWAAALAVGLAMVTMHLSKTFHLPAG